MLLLELMVKPCVSPQRAAALSFGRHSCLPSPAILIKGRLDECNVCDAARKQEIKLELERRDLENKLLAKQIHLLEKSQEHCCCPASDVGEDEG